MDGFSNLFINLAMTVAVALIAVITAFSTQIVLPTLAMLPALWFVFKMWQLAVERPEA